MGRGLGGFASVGSRNALHVVGAGLLLYIVINHNYDKCNYCNFSILIFSGRMGWFYAIFPFVRLDSEAFLGRDSELFL